MNALSTLITGLLIFVLAAGFYGWFYSAVRGAFKPAFPQVGDAFSVRGLRVLTLHDGYRGTREVRDESYSTHIFICTRPDETFVFGAIVHGHFYEGQKYVLLGRDDYEFLPVSQELMNALGVPKPPGNAQPTEDRR